MKRIYLDYAATTPLDPAVRRAMAPYFGAKFGNPGSLHFFGREALAGIDFAREKIGRVLNLEILKGFREIIFTGSATEANNLALQATLKKFKIQSASWRTKFEIPRILVSAVEHESVLETARSLSAQSGSALGGEIELVILPVDKSGAVDLEFLKKNLTENTALVSIMFANNETGVIQPIAEISKIIRDFREINNSQFPLFHSDAVQAFQYMDCSPDKIGVDLLTLSAHKICGPKGVGALYFRSGIFSQSLPEIAGGGQEFGWRSGTENVPLIVGFGQAAEIAAKAREKERRRIGDLRNFFWKELKKISPKAILNGNFEKNPADFLPNIANVYFSGLSAEELLIKLDMVDVSVSAGSACSARTVKASHVLKAMGFPENRIKSSLRFSFGRFTDREELKEFLRRMRKIF